MIFKGFETFQRMLKENPPPETEIIAGRNYGIVMTGLGFLSSYFQSKSPTISAGHLSHYLFTYLLDLLSGHNVNRNRF